jgi:RecB family exonuclease
MLGECETKYADAMFKKSSPTVAMKIGVAKHAELAQAMPKISKEDIIRDIKEGKAFGAREIMVTDDRFKLKGRIDQLDLTGRRIGSKGEGIVIDDKFTKITYDSIPLHYRIQLAAYAVAVGNSSDYGSLCEITGAKLVCRHRPSNVVRQEFSVGREELETWKSNIPLAAKVAWVLYDKKREPGHRRLDIGTGEWEKCQCGGIHK